MREITYRSLAKILFTAFTLLSTSISWAQSTPLPENLPVAEAAKVPATPGVAMPRVATGNDLYCAGYIRKTAPLADIKIIGGEEENRAAYFGQGDVLHLNAGRSKNLREGMLLSITRPMGKYRSPYKRMGGQDLGVYVRELGVMRVIAVQEKTATARIVVSCDEIQLGDLLIPFAERTSPATDVSQPLPRYQPANGNLAGRIVLQREQHEAIGPREVVYLDLGAEEGVKVGDTFTIYRKKPDDANVFHFNDDDVTLRGSSDYQSDKFKGGKFSNNHPYEARQQVKNTRQTIPQKIVGELVVIAVEGKSATAIVTRTTQEVHTGDWIRSR
ncbi:MAG: hypothetical protein U0Y68_21980 [Blastocatellia bacterium]